MAKLYYYYSTMNAGKTTTLLQSSYNYRERGMETLLFIPQIDDRYGEGKIQSRIGLSADAIAIDAGFNLFDYTAAQQGIFGDKLACVLIDEAQFLLKHQVEQLTEITTQLNIPVLCYGIRTDFLAEPFEGSLYLLAWAEELIEIKTICHCGRKATMNIRVDEHLQPVTEGAQIEIGGNDKYITTCLKHFKAGIIKPD